MSTRARLTIDHEAGEWLVVEQRRVGPVWESTPWRFGGVAFGTRTESRPCAPEEAAALRWLADEDWLADPGEHWVWSDLLTATIPVTRGVLGRSIYDQDTWWVDRKGRWHRLDEMDPEYRRAVVGFALHHAARLRDRWDPESPDPLAWAEGTALVRRLRELQPDAPRLADVVLRNVLAPDEE